MAKILICDDESGLRTLLKRYANFEGHEVVEAGDGMEAVEVCRKEKFDITIMDIMIPELDGFSAVKEIKKIYDVPVIMLSARGEEYELLFCLIRNKNIVVPREKLLNEVWGYNYFGDDRTLDTHMKLLRRSLGVYAKFITPLRGLGYRFEG